jgi:hypothetical protein
MCKRRLALQHAATEAGVSIDNCHFSRCQATWRIEQGRIDRSFANVMQQAAKSGRFDSGVVVARSDRQFGAQHGHSSSVLPRFSMGGIKHC